MIDIIKKKIMVQKIQTRRNNILTNDIPKILVENSMGPIIA